MKFRVQKVIYSDGTTKYYPQYERWFAWGRYWSHLEGAFPSIDGAVYRAGDAMKFWRFYKWYRSEGKSVYLSIKLAMEKL